tara:strand:+ start:194 stop:592 length:399 start_codon:yes stop_codon:yes gene_type:complete
MKTPKELQSIYSKLPKTELKGEKVELGILDDLTKISNTLFKDLEKSDKSWKTYQDYLSGADKPFSKMIETYNTLAKSIQFAEGIAKRFLKAGEELGVDVKNNKIYQNIEANVKTSNEVINTINSFKDPSSFQ